VPDQRPEARRIQERRRAYRRAALGATALAFSGAFIGAACYRALKRRRDVC
jgi:hypothetical protein